MRAAAVPGSIPEGPRGSQHHTHWPSSLSCDTGCYYSFLDLFFAVYLLGEVLSAGGVMVADTTLGFP